MADERKRKLEELRKKKAQLKKMVKDVESSKTLPTSPQDPAKEVSSKRTDTTSST